ncbi:MAG: hypothetical protein MUO53_12355 [Maribacter sp.]|nr:hypothetical protein [Maribacter sp.]
MNFLKMKTCATHISLLLIVVSMLSACVKNQDFGQYDNLQITPTYEGSILYLEAPESEINAHDGSNFISQIFNFDAFAEPVFADRVLDGVMTYEIANTTSKPAQLTFEFLDAADAVLDTEVFAIDPAPTAILYRETAYGNAGRSITIITSTSSIRITAENLGDSTSVSSLPNAMITFKSAAKFRIRVK